LAHFLRDYWQPRRQACRRLGNQVLEIFDGRRKATAAERVDALLARAQVGFHVHLLERDAALGLTIEVARAEEAADLLAYELLAPADMIEGSCRQWQRPIGQVELAELLRREFGLPLLPARAYAAVLLPAAPATLLQQLGLNS
jgi:hypothetical protein